MRPTDSPRWCATCDSYGLHHTDHHDYFMSARAYLDRNITAIVQEEGLCGELSPDRSHVCIWEPHEGPHGWAAGALTVVRTEPGGT